MNEFTAKEICKLIDILVGKTEPIGETNYDGKALMNLEKLIDITNWCLGRMLFARKYIHRYEDSMHKVGFTAQCAMQEWEKWLKEVEDYEV